MARPHLRHDLAALWRIIRPTRDREPSRPETGPGRPALRLAGGRVRARPAPDLDATRQRRHATFRKSPRALPRGIHQRGKARFLKEAVITSLQKHFRLRRMVCA